MHATVAKISDYLTPEQIRQLRGKSDLVGALLVLHAWALIAGSMVLFVWWPNPISFLLAAMGYWWLYALLWLLPLATW